MTLWGMDRCAFVVVVVTSAGQSGDMIDRFF